MGCEGGYGSHELPVLFVAHGFPARHSHVMLAITLVSLSSLCSSHRFPSKRDCLQSIEDLDDLVIGRFQDRGLGFQRDSLYCKPVSLVWFYFHEVTKGPQVFY